VTPVRTLRTGAVAGLPVDRILFTVLFLAAVVLAAVLSARHPVAVDWSDSGRNTLSSASAELLARMPGRIHVRAFVAEERRLREAVRQLLERYRRIHDGVHLVFVNPDREPRETERLGVRQEGELVVEYEGRRENVRGLSEASLSNALARLARGERWVAFTSGHGERALDTEARTDLGRFARHLQTSGFTVQPLDPARVEAVPDNVAVVVVAAPRAPLADAAQAVLVAHVAAGGNLLWLADPGAATLPALSRALGVAPEPGMLVDPGSRLDGRSTPEFIPVPGYASHPVTEGLEGMSAFPTATSLAWEAPAGWQTRGLAATGLRAWRETGDLDQAVSFDPEHDAAGPVDLAVAMQRPRPGGGSQRVLVVGDADFLSNAYLGLGANLALGRNAVNWLSEDDRLLDVPAVMAPDLDFAPSQPARAAIALGAPLLLPLLLLAIGLLRWQRRRAR
jgi:ABC-type uncharacterized transport system involved in gliding motility auxiliary subunit